MTPEPKTEFTLEELVRVGYEGANRIVPELVVTDELVEQSVQELKEYLNTNFGPNIEQ